MIRALVSSLVFLWVVPGPAHAAAPAPDPILDDTDRATRLVPLPGLDDPAATVVAQPDPDPDPEPGDERDSSFVSLHSRFVTVPDFVFGLLFDVHPSYQNIAAGLGLELGSVDSAMWVFELDWTPLVPDAGNWLEIETIAPGATYLESDLHMISLDVSYRRYFGITDSFHFIFGGGLGVALLVGDLNMKEVLPTCVEPVVDCPHWRSATDEAAELPTRVLPILHVTTGLQLDIGDDAMVRISAGFRNVLYAGLTVGMTL